jgi:hypothetical protein
MAPDMYQRDEFPTMEVISAHNSEALTAQGSTSVARSESQDHLI